MDVLLAEVRAIEAAKSVFIALAVHNHFGHLQVHLRCIVEILVAFDSGSVVWEMVRGDGNGYAGVRIWAPRVIFETDAANDCTSMMVNVVGCVRCDARNKVFVKPVLVIIASLVFKSNRAVVVLVDIVLVRIPAVERRDVDELNRRAF